MNIVVTLHLAAEAGTSARRDAFRLAREPEAHVAPVSRGARGRHICVVTFDLAYGRLNVTGGHRYDF